jgi:NTF2-related export protein 1/2
LGDSRGTIENYYVAKKDSADGTITTPDIQWNGNTYSTAADFKKMFTENMPKHVFFDVHAVDAQVLNPKWDAEIGTKVRAEKNISILVITNGHVRLEDRKTGPLKEFSETFVLVPNIEKMSSGKGAAAEKRNWLVQVQNFRYVVHHDPVTMAGQIDMAVD